jgi:hypothetical protein
MGTCRPYMSSLSCCYQTKYCCDGYMSSLDVVIELFLPNQILNWNLRIYAHHVVCEDGGGGTSCFPLLSVSMYSPTTFSYSSSWLFIQHLKPVLPALSARIAARSVRTCAEHQ